MSAERHAAEARPRRSAPASPAGTAFLADGIATDSANALTEREVEVSKP